MIIYSTYLVEDVGGWTSSDPHGHSDSYLLNWRHQNPPIIPYFYYNLQQKLSTPARQELIHLQNMQYQR